MLLPIIIAVAIALVGFTASQVFVGSGEKKRLKDRLTLSQQDDPLYAQKAILLRQMEAKGISGILARISLFQSLYRKLMQAWPDVSLGRFLGISVGMAVFTFLLCAAIMDSLLLGFVCGAAAGYLPFMVLGMKRNRRQRAIADQLPEALDFLGRILKAGHSITTGMQTISEELPEPLSGEFRRCYDQTSLGQPLEDCLKDMAGRIGSTDFAFFVTAVLIQKQTGGDLSEVLGNISGMIRQRVRLTQSVKAKTAEGRLTGYVLVALPAVLFVIAYVLNPAYAGILLNTSTGQIMLGIAISLQGMGLFAIRKITTIKV